MVTAGQEHRRVPAPASRTLDPPAGDLPKLPRPCLQLAVPLTRDAKVSRAQNPAARIGDRRRQRALVRINPDHVARMIGRHQHARWSRTALLGSPHRLTSSAYGFGGPADNIPVDAPTERTLPLGQADPRKQEPRPTLRQQDTLAGVNRFLSQASAQPSTLRAPSHARAQKIQHRDRFGRTAGRLRTTSHRTCCGCLDRRRERATIACPLVEGLRRPARPDGGEVPQAATGRSPNCEGLVYEHPQRYLRVEAL